MTLVLEGFHKLSYHHISFDKFDLNQCTKDNAIFRWGQVADRLERGREACEARLEALEKHARFDLAIHITISGDLSDLFLHY